ncbi:termicin-like [Periplaneta americana]|uniref:termicin-like n=1 Tax=Periplaneta americana TaxID=6978 RepID=UPI0037E988DE
MRTVAFLFVILVVVGVFIAHNPAVAQCQFNNCWATCQAEHSINFRRAFCSSGTCQCVFVRP